jgi:molybdopterin-containing oxidoreductase family iron-sulfur binding subunit
VKKMAEYGICINLSRCIGCYACVVACQEWHQIPAQENARIKIVEQWEGEYPNVSRIFLPQPTNECNFCMERIEEGTEPICVESCPTEAMLFGNLDDPKSEISKAIQGLNAKSLKPEYENKEDVYYAPLHLLPLKYQ